jgi:hypothetical protein
MSFLTFSEELQPCGFENGQSSLSFKLKDSKRVPGNSSLLHTVCRNFGDRSKEIFLTFVHAGKELSLPGGLKAASGTTLGIRQMLRNPAKAKEFADKSTSPPEVFGTTDGTQAMYCHLLCALAERARVRALRANFLIHVVSGIQFLEKHWQR